MSFPEGHMNTDNLNRKSMNKKMKIKNKFEIKKQNPFPKNKVGAMYRKVSGF